jgi:hypothetical protein
MRRTRFGGCACAPETPCVRCRCRYSRLPSFLRYILGRTSCR